MDKRMIELLEHFGLPPGSSVDEARKFYAGLSLEQRGKLGVLLGQPGQIPTTPADPDLSTRAEHDGEEPLTTRSIPLRAETLNEEDRSVEAVVSTENPVEVWDWRTGEMIDEILLNDGVELPTQVPLLANHDRWALTSVLGSVRQLRQQTDETLGRLFFVEDDADADPVWKRVRQGHLKDVSVGYRVLTAVEVEPGQTATVGGRSFTAGKLRLRIVTDWVLREVSVVPIGADQAAKIRRQQTNNVNPSSTNKEGHRMDPKLRATLESIGLRKDADDAEAQKFYEGLTGQQRAAADAAARGEPTSTTAADPPGGSQRTQPAGEQATRTDDQPTPEQAARQAITEERQRVRALRELAGDDVPEEMLNRAIDEGWDDARASREFLAAVRESRGGGTGPGIHVRDHDTDCNVRTLSAGLLISQGVDPTRHRMHDGRRFGQQFTEQDAELGERFSRMSAIDLVRECALRDTGRFYHDPDDALRAAMSGTSMTNAFSTNVYARLLGAWETVGDTTVGWCDEEDVANFLQQEDISVEASSQMKKLPPGGTATDATASDSHETYKIARYAKKFTVDEQDILNDRLGAIMRIPEDMGRSARELRPNLVYALMLANPNLVADSGAVFNATAVTTAGGHANLGTAALANDALKAAITAMASQRLGRTASEPGRVLNLRPRFLIVPPDLEWTARGLTSAAALAKLFADSSDPWYEMLNLLAQEGIRVVIDGRIDATGVRDPNTDTVRTGSATNWFLTAGGPRGLRVAYRRGTNRQPVMRSFLLDRGQWGVGWDINLDIGAAFMDYRPWYKSTGAA